MPFIDKIPPAMQVMIGAILISFSGVYVKLSQTGPTASGVYRVFFGGMMLLALSFSTRENRPKGIHFLYWSLIAGVCFALDLFTWHISIHYVGPGLATILANFQVFFLAVIGIFFLGERLNLQLIATIPIAVLGLFMIVGIDWDLLDRKYQIGILLGLTTAICYTGYIMSLRKLQSLREAPSPMLNLALVSLITAAILAGLAGVQGESLWIPDVISAIYLLLYGLFSQVLGWLLIGNGLTAIRPSLAGLLLLLQPTLAFIWDILFFDKQTTPINLMGTGITLLAIYLGSTSRRPSLSAEQSLSDRGAP